MRPALLLGTKAWSDYVFNNSTLILAERRELSLWSAAQLVAIEIEPTYPVELSREDIIMLYHTIGPI